MLARVHAVDEEEAARVRADVRGDMFPRWARVQPAIYGMFGSPPDQTPLMFPSGTQPRAMMG